MYDNVRKMITVVLSLNAKNVGDLSFDFSSGFFIICAFQHGLQSHQVSFPLDLLV
jgi:hypothetical protein